MATHSKPLSQRRATVLVSIIITLVVLQLTIVLVISGGSRQQTLSMTRFQGAQAQYAAEAGVQLSLRELARGIDEDGDGGVGTISSGSSLAFQSSSIRVFSSSGYIATASNSGARRRVTVTATASGTVAGLPAAFFANTIGGTDTCSVTANDANWTTQTPSAIGRVFEAQFPGQQYSLSYSRWLGGNQENYGIRIWGDIWIPTAGVYTFGTNSDDQSGIWINGTYVLNNWYNQSNTWRTATSATLPAGWNTFELRFIECGGNDIVGAAITGPGYPSWTPIRGTMLRGRSAGIPPLSVHTTATIGNGSTVNVTGFRSGVGAFNQSTNNVGGQNLISTNSTSSSAIGIGAATTVNGNLAVGPGGNSSTGITVISGGSIGTRSVRTNAVGISPQSQLQTGLWQSNWPGEPTSSGILNQSSGTLTVTGDRSYTNVTLTGTAVMNITADCNIYVNGNLNLTNSAAITIASGVRVTMYITGGLSAANNSRINMSPGLPQQLRIEMGYGVAAVVVGDTARIAAYINSISSPMSMSGTSTGSPAEFHGIFRGPSFSATGPCNIRLDLDADGSGSTLTLTSWQQNNANP